MKCPHCGFTGSDDVASCGKCGRELADARRALGLPPARRAPRATTPILDGPVDPSLIEDGPPAPAEPLSPSILDLETGRGGTPEGGEFGTPGAGETGLDEILAGTDPVDPSEIAPAPRPGAQAPSGPAPEAGDVIDFGEPLELDERAAAPPGAPPGLASTQTSSRTPAALATLEAHGLPAEALRDWPEDGQDGWEGIDAEIGVSRDPRVLPKGGFWLRVVASTTDSIFLQIVSSMVLFVVGSWSGATAIMASHMPAPGENPEAAAEAVEQALRPLLSGALGWSILALLLFALLYRPVCHARWGRTLGKKLVGIRVVTKQGENPGFGRACWREIGYLLSSLPLGLGLLWVAWDPQKQGWHDKLAGTYVLKENG